MRILYMAIGKLCGFGRIKRPFAVPLMDLFPYLDFGLGDENYKKYWCNDTVNLSRYLNFKSFKGFFAYLLIRIYIFFKY